MNLTIYPDILYPLITYPYFARATLYPSYIPYYIQLGANYMEQVPESLDIVWAVTQTMPLCFACPVYVHSVYHTFYLCCIYTLTLSLPWRRFGAPVRVYVTGSLVDLC